MPLDDISGKVCLVTGATGMIGSYVTRMLVRKKCIVYALVRWRSNLHNLAGLLPSVHLEYGDILDPYRMQQLIEQIRPDYVYHFAAQAINGVSFTSPSISLQVNVMGTLHVLEAIRQTSGLGSTTRIFVAGSSTEYGLCRLSPPLSTSIFLDIFRHAC